MSLLGSVVALQSSTFLAHLLTGHVPEKRRGRITSTVFASSFTPKDGKSFIIQTVGAEKRDKVFELAGLDKDPRFDTREKRHQNEDQMFEVFDAFFATKTRDEWLKILVEADIVCAPVYSYPEVANDPQVLANKYVVEINHPTEGSARIIGNPIHLSRCEARTGVAPLLGQHTEEVLKEAGYSEKEIAELKEEKVI